MTHLVPGAFSKGPQSRQIAELDEFEGRSPAGRDEADVVAQSIGRSAATESPPPTTLIAGVAGDRARDRFGAAAKAGSSKTPIGPFQRIVRALAITASKISIDAGPISRPMKPSGMFSPKSDRLDQGRRRDRTARRGRDPARRPG